MNEINTVVAWVYDDQQGNERPLKAIIPPGIIIPLMAVEGSEDEEQIDVIARQYATSGRVVAYKRRYQAVEDLEVVNGRELSAKRAAHAARRVPDRVWCDACGAGAGDLHPL